MYELPESSILFADSNRGIFIPQHFAESVNRDCVSGVPDSHWEALESGPDHIDYWEAWHDVELSAVVTDSDGEEYALYHDGDLWLVPADCDLSPL